MRKLLSTILAAVVGSASISLLAPAAFAADWPQRPIKFVVPFSPGTGMDRIARLVGEKLQTRLGQPVVIDNKTGVSGHLGAQAVAQSPADGYTFLVSATNLPITANLYPSPKFNAMTELVPMGIAAWGNATLVASNKLPARNLREIIALAKASPGKISFATPGAGSPSHLNLEQFQEETGAKFLAVHYKGTGPAVSDVLGGHVDLMFVASHTVAPYVKAGQVKPIAIGSSKRNPALPDTPTFREAGFPGFSTDAWYGFLAPKGTPAEITDKLWREIREILLMPEIKSDIEKSGLEVRPSTAEEMRTVMNKEYAMYGDIIKRNGIKPD